MTTTVTTLFTSVSNGLITSLPPYRALGSHSGSVNSGGWALLLVDFRRTDAVVQTGGRQCLVINKSYPPKHRLGLGLGLGCVVDDSLVFLLFLDKNFLISYSKCCAAYTVVGKIRRVGRSLCVSGGPQYHVCWQYCGNLVIHV